MRLLLLCSLIMLVLPDANGNTCVCSCCRNIGCALVEAGSRSVTACTDCTKPFCVAQFPSSCSAVNGDVREECRNDPASTASFLSGHKSLSLGVLAASLSMYVYSLFNVWFTQLSLPSIKRLLSHSNSDVIWECFMTTSTDPLQVSTWLCNLANRSIVM